MKILNLAKPETSDIKFEVSSFPDGQQNVTINPDYVSPLDYVQISSRFNSFKDLEKIICATKALRRLEVRSICLYIPYLLGARSDRQFKAGGNSYLVDVVAPILNSLKFTSVTVLDVHSDVAPACINRLKLKDNTLTVAKAINTLYGEDIENKFRFISPDGGSIKKIHHMADFIDPKAEIIYCSKTRDTEGKLTNVVIPIRETQYERDFIIIDDICDGGRTFINIAKPIKEHRDQYGLKGKTYLIVTHGIFSAGFEELCKYFDHIYTTNSVIDHNGHYMTEVEGQRLTYKANPVSDLVTQFNVF